MKLNKKINKKREESSRKMRYLKIPDEKRREYIDKVYSSSKRLKESYGCLTGLLINFTNLFTRPILRDGLDELIKEKATPEESVLRIKRIIAGEYRDHKDSPPINDWF